MPPFILEPSFKKLWLRAWSYHMTQFYQAFPRVSTASDKRWGEKAWVQDKPELSSAIINLLYDLALPFLINGHDSSSGRKW